MKVWNYRASVSARSKETSTYFIVKVFEWYNYIFELASKHTENGYLSSIINIWITIGYIIKSLRILQLLGGDRWVSYINRLEWFQTSNTFRSTLEPIYYWHYKHKRPLHCTWSNSIHEVQKSPKKSLSTLQRGDPNPQELHGLCTGL